MDVEFMLNDAFEVCCSAPVIGGFPLTEQQAIRPKTARLTTFAAAAAAVDEILAAQAQGMVEPDTVLAIILKHRQAMRTMRLQTTAVRMVETGMVKATRTTRQR